MEALIREVAEDMCVKLTLKVLDQCVADAQLVADHGRKSPVHSWCFIHITGISCKAGKERKHAGESMLRVVCLK